MDLQQRGYFYVHVNSAPTEVFPDNTPTKFNVHLPETLQLASWDTWEMALTYLTMPNAWVSTQEAAEEFSDDEDDEGLTMSGTVQVLYRVARNFDEPNARRGGWSKVIVPRGPYKKKEDLVTFLNRSRPAVAATGSNGNIFDTKRCLEWLLFNGTLVLRRKQGVDVCIEIKMSQALRRATKFPLDVQLRSGFPLNPQITGELPFMSPRQEPRRKISVPEFLGIKCNLVDFEFMSDGRKEQLLFCTTDCSMFHTRDRYMCYTRSRLDQMEFEVLDQNGRRHHLDESGVHRHRSSFANNTHLGLVFRRCPPLESTSCS
jgi:hypothetical protein